ncbi:MAG TPA: hypothetical protein DCP11_00005, partial [Microbacteriaceae bacterium]|nr:hypothetical protein [Microbacteriaceae bacterium]
MFASDPAPILERGLPRFVEEHCGYSPDGAPRAEVSGTIASITGLYYPRLPAGENGVIVDNTVRPYS